MIITTRRPPVEYPAHIPQIVHFSAAQILAGLHQKEPALPTFDDGSASSTLELAAQIVRYTAEQLRLEGWSEEMIETVLRAHGLAFVHPVK